MSPTSRLLALWRRLSVMPIGKWAFSRLVCWKAPYFGSVRPRFESLEPGLCEVTIRKRRAVLNHIGTVHAIAMCNMAELAAGTMTEVSIPATHRWIPRGMTVEYLAKAATDLRAVAELDPLQSYGPAADVPVTVKVTDTNGKIVFRAVISMWVSPKKS